MNRDDLACEYPLECETNGERQQIEAILSNGCVVWIFRRALAACETESNRERRRKR
jgi:hypothetical protein